MLCLKKVNEFLKVKKGSSLQQFLKSKILKLNIKEYHVYRNVCLPVLNEGLYGEMDPNNHVDKYAAAVKKATNWHLDIYY